MNKPKLFIITGPTASGKTSVSISVARLINAEIISADAIQLYKGLDIGSAKPTDEEKCGIKHYMMDCISPNETDFTVSRFRDGALEAAREIIAKGKRPLVVGGTGLYINSLTYPLTFSNIAPDSELRQELIGKEQEQKGSLHELLCQMDEKTAKRLHPNDIKRIVRALEICIKSGKKASEQGEGFGHRDDDSLEFEPVMAGITMNRAALYERIEKRVDNMFSDGLVDEVRSLLEQGCTQNMPAMQGLGYKETIAYINGECTLDEAKDKIKRETRRFAKRQLTWFRREERIRWFDSGEYKTGDELAKAITEYFMLQEGQNG